MRKKEEKRKEKRKRGEKEGREKGGKSGRGEEEAKGKLPTYDFALIDGADILAFGRQVTLCSHVTYFRSADFLFRGQRSILLRWRFFLFGVSVVRSREMVRN